MLYEEKLFNNLWNKQILFYQKSSSAFTSAPSSIKYLTSSNFPLYAALRRWKSILKIWIYIHKRITTLFIWLYDIVCKRDKIEDVAEATVVDGIIRVVVEHSTVTLGIGWGWSCGWQTRRWKPLNENMWSPSEETIHMMSLYSMNSMLISFENVCLTYSPWKFVMSSKTIPVSIPRLVAF